MSSVNVLAREVAAKIVFYGPGLSGKTTTLRKIYESVRPANRGEMMSLATEGDRTLFFDFLPVKVERVGDCSVRLALYTVPGQVFYNATRKLVLQGADGVVFVADSQPEAMDKNRESLLNLEENLAEQGIRFDRFPVVFQWNKRDLGKLMAPEELHAALNTRDAPEFETCATDGKGILDTLKAVTRLVIKDLRQKRVVPAPRMTPANGVVALEPGPAAGLEQQLQQHLNREPGAPITTLSAGPRWNGHLAAPVATKARLGPTSTLAPRDLLDYARAADTAFALGDFPSCVRACVEAVRRALAYSGDASVAGQGYLLRMDGPDLMRMQGLSTVEAPRAEDAAFAMYVTMQAFLRLAAAPLPTKP